MTEELFIDFSPFWNDQEGKFNGAFELVQDKGDDGDVLATATVDIGFSFTLKTKTEEGVHLKVLTTEELSELFVDTEVVRAYTDLQLKGYRSCEVDVIVKKDLNVIILKTTIYGNNKGINLRITTPLNEKHNSSVKGTITFLTSEEWFTHPAATDTSSQIVLHSLRRIRRIAFFVGMNIAGVEIKSHNGLYRIYSIRRDLFERLRVFNGSNSTVTVEGLNYSKYFFAYANAYQSKMGLK